MRINNLFKQLEKEKLPFALFLRRALSATEQMNIEERAERIAEMWKHKARHYTTGELS